MKVHYNPQPPAYQDPEELEAYLEGYRLGFEMMPVSPQPHDHSMPNAFFKGFHEGVYDGDECDVDLRAREIIAARARAKGGRDDLVFAEEVIAGAWDHENRNDIATVRLRLMVATMAEGE